MAIYWLSEVAYINAVRKAIDVYDRDKVRGSSDVMLSSFRVTKYLSFLLEVSVKLLVAVKTLPKGALVEKQVMAHTGRAWIEEEDSDYDSDEKKELVLKTVQPIFEQG